MYQPSGQQRIGPATASLPGLMTAAQFEQLAALAANPPYPVQWEASHLLSTYTVGSASYDANDINGTTGIFASRGLGTGNDGDSFQHKILLAAGTYTFSVMGVTYATFGKVTFALNGTNFLVTDWNAGLAQNVIQSGSLVVPTSGIQTLTGTVTGSSSSGYGNQFQWFTIK